MDELPIHYYLSIFPLEALISSHLTPEQFGHYMAAGQRKGSYERIMFIEVEGGFGSEFDWKWAEGRTVRHPDGRPKHSVWLSVYRTLEHVPPEKLGTLYLTNQDGRALALEKSEYQAPPSRDYYVYQEICPITPLVVSNLDPKGFAEHMTAEDSKVHVPRLAFSDVKVVNFDDLETTGNIGTIYDKNIDHLKECIRAVVGNTEKPNKNLERSTGSFSYQIINNGVYIGSKSEIVMYKMPTVSEIRQHHYDWGRSAMIL